MKKLCIISECVSELSTLLMSCCRDAVMVNPDDAAGYDLDRFDSFALLCGASGRHILLPDTRSAVERQIRAGKPFFSEFCSLIGNLRSYENVNTRHERPVLLRPSDITGNLQTGVIFDEQSNDRIRYFNATGEPILQYVRDPVGFYVMQDAETTPAAAEDFALFRELPNLLVCSFRMSDFASAKFAPRRVWCELIAGVVRFLGLNCDPETVYPFFARVYSLRNADAPLSEVTDLALKWYENNDMFIMRNGLPYAVKEGLGADVHPDGTHRILSEPRPDCAGELSLACYLNWLLTDDARMLACADGLMRMPHDCLIQEEGPHCGMMRWTHSGWWVSYQDDTARALLLPGLYRALAAGDVSELPSVKLALDYLLSTTGSDGLRVYRTDYVSECGDGYSFSTTRWNETARKWEWYDSEKGKVYTKEELRSMPSGCVSSHYNAYYLASLLLYSHLTGDRTYYDAGVKGLETLMAAYPNGAREHSQTQDICRMILPLAVLWKVTDDPEKKKWLYRVTDDLQKLKHRGGGYVEWDTGYISVCAGVRGGESSVLAANGDPVSDMLYSLGWLSLALCTAYYFTKDPMFKKLRDDFNRFIAEIQVISPDPVINGVWTRSVDLDNREVYGVPNDIGWAPWSVETGWGMAETICGLLLAQLEDRVINRF